MAKKTIKVKDLKVDRSRFIFKHQYKPEFRQVDEYSDTTPDLVLSMRDVYKKYVMTGTIEGLGAGRPLVQDDRLMEEFPEEVVDSLYLSNALRESVLADIKPEDKPVEKPEDKPVENPEDKPEDVPRDDD